MPSRLLGPGDKADRLRPRRRGPFRLLGSHQRGHRGRRGLLGGWRAIGRQPRSGLHLLSVTDEQAQLDNWGQVKKLTASDAGNEDYFGRSVAISGDTLVVGAHLNKRGPEQPKGAAYIFERNHNAGDPGAPLADNWGQVTRLTASDATQYDYFGCSVAISGDTVVVGAWGKTAA